MEEDGPGRKGGGGGGEGGGGGYSAESLVRVCGSVLKSLTLFQTKICNFLVTFFRPGF